ncbi:hypothetical protein, partial [Caldisphaera sp.]|uniref:hypothetical protein n=1 Tax=Caldisphaera sp. TaxID=2060322 RepID=UPI003D0AB0D7
SLSTIIKFTYKVYKLHGLSETVDDGFNLDKALRNPLLTNDVTRDREIVLVIINKIIINRRNCNPIVDELIIRGYIAGSGRTLTIKDVASTFLFSFTSLKELNKI